MSGHNRWSQIKQKKGVADQKRGQLFSKLSEAISMAARKGSDPDKNLELRNAIEQAREFDLPKDNIERAVNKVTNKSTTPLEELVIEAISSAGVNFIITAITDNKNRTIAKVKKILTNHEAKMAQPGSVRWAFDKTGTEFSPKYPLKTIDEITKNKLEKLLKELDDQEEIQEIYTNY